MKTTALALIALSSLSAHAVDPTLYFVDTGKKAQAPFAVTKDNTDWMNTYDICYLGSGWLARDLIYRLIKNDIEKKSPKADFDQNNNVIYYGYTDLNCANEAKMVRDEVIYDQVCKIELKAYPCKFR